MQDNLEDLGSKLNSLKIENRIPNLIITPPSAVIPRTSTAQRVSPYALSYRQAKKDNAYHAPKAEEYQEFHNYFKFRRSTSDPSISPSADSKSAGEDPAFENTTPMVPCNSSDSELVQDSGTSQVKKKYPLHKRRNGISLEATDFANRFLDRRRHK